MKYKEHPATKHQLVSVFCNKERLEWWRHVTARRSERREPVTSGSCACPMTETCFSTTIPLKVANAACANCERSHWTIKSFPIDPRAVVACAQSPVLQSPNVSSIVSQNSFLGARSTAIADESGLNVNSWLECLTCQRLYDHEAVLQTSRPWNGDNTRKSIQMSAPRVKRRVEKSETRVNANGSLTIFRYKRRSFKVSLAFTRLSLSNLGSPRKRRNPFRMLLIK